MSWTNQVKKELDRNHAGGSIISAGSLPGTPKPSSRIGGCTLLSLILLSVATIFAFAKGWQEAGTVCWLFAFGYFVLGLLADLKQSLMLLVLWVMIGFGMVWGLIALLHN